MDIKTAWTILLLAIISEIALIYWYYKVEKRIKLMEEEIKILKETKITESQKNEKIEFPEWMDEKEKEFFLHIPKKDWPKNKKYFWTYEYTENGEKYTLTNIPPSKEDY